MAANAPHTIRRIFPAIIVLLLVPLNGSSAYFHMLPKAVPLITISVIGLLIVDALVLRQRTVVLLRCLRSFSQP